jgi:phenylacetate-CoA ligase
VLDLTPRREDLDPIETATREEIAALQLVRLKETVKRVYDNVAHYRKAFDAAGVLPQDLASLADLAKLPFTTKADLRASYPFGMFATPQDRIVRIHASSGTTGKPTVVGYTKADIETWSQVVARSLRASGARPGMKLHNAYGYGLFTGGLGLHGGGEQLGMAVVPVSGGLTERQLMLIEDFRPDLIACTPSYALTLAQAFAGRGIPPERISLRIAMLGAEPWTEAMRREIDARLGVSAVNVYGLSEIVGPGVACECAEERAGLHVNEDHFLTEVVDPESGEPVEDGGAGVLVFTTLTKEAFPLVRYWTGDIASLNRAPCRCGRTFVRTSPPAGRADDMLIIRGVNVYPSQVEAILLELPELTPDYRIVVERTGTLDEATVEIETAEPRAELQERAERLLVHTIGCTIAVRLLPPGSVPRSEGGKLQRVDDRRRL